MRVFVPRSRRNSYAPRFEIHFSIPPPNPSGIFLLHLKSLMRVINDARADEDHARVPAAAAPRFVTSGRLKNMRPNTVRQKPPVITSSPGQTLSYPSQIRPAKFHKPPNWISARTMRQTSTCGSVNRNMTGGDR